MASWFKFYGPEYLSDPKMLGMDGNTRSCWLTLLCYASNGDGEVKYLTEEQLMIQAGVPLGGAEWDQTLGILKRFEERDMIQIERETLHLPNWNKRQANLTGYERIKRFRGKSKEDEDVITHDNAVITTEREIDKKDKREKKEEKVTASLKFLTEIPLDHLKELTEKYEASTRQIQRKGEELKNYCDSIGKTYKNYRAFMENALSKDFGRRVQAPVVVQEEKRSMTDAEQAAFDRISREIRGIGANKRVEA